MGRKICFIGSHGFIAKSLSQKLLGQGYEVSGVSSKQCDLTQVGAGAALAKLIPSQSTVVLTSTITPDKGKDASVTFKNILIGENVFTALEAVGVQQFVYVSSDAVYSDYDLISESTPCDPSTLYGSGHIFKEKLFGEQAARKGWPLTIVRPVAVFGPGDTHNSYGPNRFLRSAIKSKEITLFGEGEEMRDHIYIEDLCELFSRTIADYWVGILNGASGKAHSFMSIAKEAQRLAGEKAEIKCLPRSSPITHKHFDITKLLQTYPDFSPTPLDEALQKTYDAFKLEG